MREPTISRERVNGFRLEAQALSPRLTSTREALDAAGWIPSGASALLATEARIHDLREDSLDRSIEEGERIVLDTVRGGTFLVPRPMAAAVLRSPATSVREAAERSLGAAAVPFAGRESLRRAVMEALTDGHLGHAPLRDRVTKGGGAAAEFLAKPGVLGAVLTQLRLDARVVRTSPPGAVSCRTPVFVLAENLLPGEDLTGLSPRDALLILCAYYFRVHGPATRADFGWWSGAGRTEVAEAFAVHEKNLARMRMEGLPFTYYLPPSRLEDLKSYERAGADPVLLVPFRDPWLSSHEGRVERFIRTEDMGRIRPGLALPAILVGGVVAGRWELETSSYEVRLHWFRTPIQGVAERAASRGLAIGAFAKRALPELLPLSVPGAKGEIPVYA